MQIDPSSELKARRTRRVVLSRSLQDVAGRTILSLALVSIALGFTSFDSFGVPSDSEIRQASAAVVFTGAFERVDAGLHLVNTGYVSQLYISGMNAGAGIVPAHFVNQFALRNPHIADLRRLIECCVEWGEKADNTFQNALDAKCWVERRKVSGPVLLITSRSHMARAISALSGALPGRVLIPYPVDDDASSRNDLRRRTFEYVKYLATIVAIRLPGVIHLEEREGRRATICADSL